MRVRVPGVSLESHPGVPPGGAGDRPGLEQGEGPVAEEGGRGWGKSWWWGRVPGLRKGPRAGLGWIRVRSQGRVLELRKGPGQGLWLDRGPGPGQGPAVAAQQRSRGTWAPSRPAAGGPIGHGAGAGLGRAVQLCFISAAAVAVARSGGWGLRPASWEGFVGTWGGDDG